jgi:hypothetical protein
MIAGQSPPDALGARNYGLDVSGLGVNGSHESSTLLTVEPTTFTTRSGHAIVSRGLGSAISSPPRHEGI